jgi:hypothetical protein
MPDFLTPPRDRRVRSREGLGTAARDALDEKNEPTRGNATRLDEQRIETYRDGLYA